MIDTHSQANVALSISVANEVQRCINDAPIAPPYREALTAALRLPSNILSDTPNARWAKLVWTCCGAANGQWEQAVSVAAAVEMFMVALDVLDDVEDGESTPLHIAFGPSGTLNISTGLLFLTQQRLLQTLFDAAAVSILLDAGLRATSGQHAGLADGAAQCYDVDAALRVTASKSASLIAAICQLGALCAGADEVIQMHFNRFGWCIGMVAQLVNDIVAISPYATGKTDIALARPTLPLVYTAHYSSVSAPVNDAATRSAVWNNGSTYLTWAIAETYRRQAFDIIPHLSTDYACQDHLAALLPRLCWTQEEDM